MAETKRILPLVGRVIKKRLGEFKRQAKEELRAGYDELRAELQRELDDADDEQADAKRDDAGTPAGRARIETGD